MLRHRLLEALLVAILLALGVVVGSFAGRHFSGAPQFYQGEFGPAVMVAAGRGFVSPVLRPGTPITEFLELRRQALSPADVAGVDVGAPNQFQLGHRYLLLAVGYGWRLSGISWPAVAGVGAILYGLSIAACYGICRVWLPQWLAVVGALFICFSPLHLSQVPHVRDYSKAPFILLAILLTSLVAVRPLSRRLVVLLSAACGVVVGIGLGFKMDVVIMAPIFVASLIAFRDRRPWTGLGEKAVAAGAFALALLIAAGPVLLRLSSGGTNGFHVILLGYSDQFDGALEITRPAYSILPFYDDGYAMTVVKSYGARLTGTFPAAPSPEYDAAGRAYWLAIVRHFPADILTRALAAANGVLNIPFNESSLNFLWEPRGRTSVLWTLLTRQPPHRARISALYEGLSMLSGWGAVFGVLLVAAGSVRSARLGLFAAWMLLALTAYSSLQFAGRHIFHLEIIPVLGVLVALHLPLRRRWPGVRAVARFAAAVAVLALAIVASVATLRAYQRSHLRRVFQEYVDAPRQPVAPAFADIGDGSWRAQWNTLDRVPSTNAPLTADYYVVEFDGPSKPEMTVFRIRYRSKSPGDDYSRFTSMSVEPGVNRVFIPAYTETPAWGFDGLDLPAGIRTRLRGIYRVAHPEQLPLLLDLKLSAAWQRGTLTQTFRTAENGSVDDIQLLGSAAATTGSRIAMIGRLDSPETLPSPAAVAIASTNAVRVTSSGIEMDGAAETQSSYLLSFKPVEVKGPAALLVRGHLYTGGVAFGLLKDNRWYRNLSTGNAGDFIAIVDIPDAGTYVPILTNATVHDHDRNRFTVSRFGIVHADSPRP